MSEINLYLIQTKDNLQELIENLLKVESKSIEENILLALSIRYIGDIRKSIDILNELLASVDKITEIERAQINLLLYLNFYDLNQNTKLQSTVKRLNLYQSKYTRFRSFDEFWKAIWMSVIGLEAFRLGHEFEAIENLKQGLYYIKETEFHFEIMRLNYLIGFINRKVGNLAEAERNFIESIKYSEQIKDDLGLAKNNNTIAEVYFLRHPRFYPKALESLTSALEIWEKSKITLGISWALHDLGILHRLKGEFTKAIDFLVKALELSSLSSSLDPIYQIKTILEIIDTSFSAKNIDTAEEYFNKLEKIPKLEENYSNEYFLAQGIMKRFSQRLVENLSAQYYFQTVSNVLDIDQEFIVKAQVNQLELILLELHHVKSAEGKFEAETLIKSLEKRAEQSFELMVQTRLLSAQLATISNNYELARDLLTQTQDLVKNKGYKKYLEDTNLLLAELLVTQEYKTLHKNLDPLLHSIPRLNIILQIVPKKYVSFSDLHKATELTQGNMSNHLNKLVAANYITSEKRFIDTRSTTIYKITDLGLLAFDNYIKQLDVIFTSFLH